MTPVDGDRLAHTLSQVLHSYCAKLNKFLKKATLQAFANSMFEEGLITIDLRDDPVYNEIEEHFNLLLEFLSCKEDFEDHCKKFIQALRSLRGSMEVVADRLRDDWREKVNRELHIDLNL